jgi:hypothetical protein
MNWIKPKIKHLTFTIHRNPPPLGFGLPIWWWGLGYGVAGVVVVAVGGLLVDGFVLRVCGFGMAVAVAGGSFGFGFGLGWKNGFGVGGLWCFGFGLWGCRFGFWVWVMGLPVLWWW